MTMQLSGLLITRDAAPWLPYVLANMRSWADEVVVVVDMASADDSYQIARRLADTVALWDTGGYCERVLQHATKLCRGQWIMRLDDDELMPPLFRQEADYLLTRPADDFMLRRLHLSDGQTMIDAPALWPDPQIRLRSARAYRDNPWPAVPHAIPAWGGGVRWNICTTHTTIWHLHYLLRPPAHWQAQAARLAAAHPASSRALDERQAAQTAFRCYRTAPAGRPAELDDLLRAVRVYQGLAEPA